VIIRRSSVDADKHAWHICR